MINQGFFLFAGFPCRFFCDKNVPTIHKVTRRSLEKKQLEYEMGLTDFLFRMCGQESEAVITHAFLGLRQNIFHV
ncbi:hypothetical protein AB4Z22_39740, partial [Paenibacillus sp. TAF58]